MIFFFILQGHLLEVSNLLGPAQLCWSVLLFPRMTRSPPWVMTHGGMDHRERVGAQHVHVLTQYSHTGPTLCGEQAVLCQCVLWVSPSLHHPPSCLPWGPWVGTHEMVGSMSRCLMRCVMGHDPHMVSMSVTQGNIFMHWSGSTPGSGPVVRAPVHYLRCVRGHALHCCATRAGCLTRPPDHPSMGHDSCRDSGHRSRGS